MDQLRDYLNRPITVSWPVVGALPSRGTLIYLGESYLVLRDVNDTEMVEVIPLPAIAHVGPG